MATFTLKDVPKLLHQIEKGKTEPLYLIAGDSYLVQDIHREIIQRLLPEEIRSFNLRIMDGEKEGLQAILEELQTFPFFPGRKVVSVTNPIQLFSAAKEGDLLKKAEESWIRGQKDRCFHLLGQLFNLAGLSLKEAKKRLAAEDTELIAEFLPLKEGPLPAWLKEAAEQLPDDAAAEPLSGQPGRLLETALRKGLPKGHILVLLFAQLPTSKKLLVALAEQGVLLNLSLRQAKRGEQMSTLKTHLKTRLAEEGRTIHPEAEALLLERVGSEVFLLEMEVQKLAAFLGDRKQIGPQDILEVTGLSREEPFYEFTKVLGDRSLSDGLRILRQLWEQGYNPLQILTGITNSLRRLLLAHELLANLDRFSPQAWKDYGAFSARILPRLKETPLPEPFSKAHPYVLFNTLKSARNFSREEIIKALEKLQETDRVLKTTGVTPSFLLEDFIFFLCRQPKIKNFLL
jgi:DNA polymerase III subunit delta